MRMTNDLQNNGAQSPPPAESEDQQGGLLHSGTVDVDGRSIYVLRHSRGRTGLKFLPLEVLGVDLDLMEEDQPCTTSSSTAFATRIRQKCLGLKTGTVEAPQGLKIFPEVPARSFVSFGEEQLSKAMASGT